MREQESIAPTQESKAARDLLLAHFPKYEWTEKELESEAFFLTSSWLIAGDLVEAIDKKNVQERLDKIERLTNELWKEYHALPLKIRSDRIDLWRRLMRIKYDLTGKTPFVSSSKLFQSPYEFAMPRKKGLLSTIRERVDDFFSMHQTQRDAEFSNKVRLCEIAVELWLKFERKKAPLKASQGTRYHNFIADLIDFSGKQWSVDRTMNAYRVFHKNDDRGM